MLLEVDIVDDVCEEMPVLTKMMIGVFELYVVIVVEQYH